MQISPYLSFDGTCREAMTWYAQVLGGSLDIMPLAGSPAEGHIQSDAPGEFVLHAALMVEEQLIMASDCPPGSYEKPAGTFVSINYPTPEEARRVYDTLVEGGTVVMPFEPTFWSSGFGMLTDRFGTPWMVGAGPASE